MKPLKDLAALLATLPAGATIVLHSACAEPRVLAASLAASAASAHGAHVLTLMPMGTAPYAEPAAAAHLDNATFFPGTALRRALASGAARPLRHALSAIPGLFERGELRADALLLQVSPPDESGHVSLGLAVDYMRAVLQQRPLVVAEINPKMPRTCGDTLIHTSEIDWFVEATEPPQPVEPAAPDNTDTRIAANVASLVSDGAVLQLGIGSLPDCVARQLRHLKHLGLHSGVITSPIQELVEIGAIDNSRKRQFAGVSVTAMAVGPQSFYDFLHRNAAVQFYPCSVTHDRARLAQIDRLYAINSALQVDLEGRVNAEVVGGRRISMPGGLPDFAAGARRSAGGASIVALRSTHGAGGPSNIVRAVGETTVPAGDVDFVVTEHGIAALRDLGPVERTRALIQIAHPAVRETLERAIRREPSEDNA